MRRALHPSTAVWLAALLVLMVASAGAQSQSDSIGDIRPRPIAIQAGIDLWSSGSDGGTFADFAGDPIPAGFFCDGSDPFVGMITLHGVPLVTEPPGVLANTDTIVERLDDVPLAGGMTQIRIRALQLHGDQLLEVFCPDLGEFTYWQVIACLTGTQTIGEMDVFAEGEGGFFNAYLPVDVALTFIQVDTTPIVDDPMGGGPDEEPVEEEEPIQTLPGKAHKVGAPLMLTQSLSLVTTGAPWALQPVPNTVTFPAGLLIDADCDGIPESGVAGTSNFLGGWNPAAGGPAPVPHQAPQHQHITMPPLPSDCSCI